MVISDIEGGADQDYEPQPSIFYIKMKAYSSFEKKVFFFQNGHFLLIRLDASGSSEKSFLDRRRFRRFPAPNRVWKVSTFELPILWIGGGVGGTCESSPRYVYLNIGRCLQNHKTQTPPISFIERVGTLGCSWTCVSVFLVLLPICRLALHNKQLQWVYLWILPSAKPSSENDHELHMVQKLILL